jgi:hypothetical protein
MMSDEIEWIKAPKAHALLIGAGVHPAEFKIRQALRLGKVKARAIEAVIERRTAGHWTPKEVKDDWIVPKEVWKGSGDDGAFDLNNDYFSNRSYETGYRSVRLTGLSFDKAEIIEYFDIEEAPVPRSPPVVFDDATKDKGGAALDSEKWANFAAIAVVLQHHAGLVHKGMKKAQVYSQIADYASSLDLAIPSDTGVSKAFDKMKQLSGLKHSADGQPMFDDHGQPIKA